MYIKKEVVMIRKFISYYKPHKLMFFLDMLASLFVSIIGLSYSILTKKMTGTWINEGEKGLNKIIFFGSLLLLLYFVRMLLRYFIQYYGHVIGVKMQADMRNDLFKKLQKLPYSYYNLLNSPLIFAPQLGQNLDLSFWLA